MCKEELKKIIEEKEKEIEYLKDSLLDVTTELNYSKYKELAELVRELYTSLNGYDPEDKEFKNLSTKDIVDNLKKVIEDFSKDYKFLL